MNILITGGSGFLGKHLTKFLKKKKYSKVISLSSKDADLRLSGSLNKLNKIKFRKIYHLAALLSSKAEHSPQLAQDVNVNGTLKLLNLAIDQTKKNNHIVKFFFTS